MDIDETLSDRSKNKFKGFLYSTKKTRLKKILQ